MSAHRALAERDALLDLIAIFTHDLSNPLQSITVLCELGVDEAEPGSEERLRAEQCLEAAQRMRAILQGLGGVTRHADQASPLAKLLGRVQRILGRRFDRHHMTVVCELGSAEAVESPAGLEFAIINTFLGFMHGAAEASAHNTVVAVRATRLGNDRCQVLLDSTASDADGHAERLALPERHMERLRDITRDIGVSCEFADDSVLLEFPIAQTG